MKLKLQLLRIGWKFLSGMEYEYDFYNNSTCPSFTSGSPLDHQAYRRVLDLVSAKKPSEFNYMKCCDFSMISRGMDVGRLFTGDNSCNETAYSNGLKPVYPHSEAPATLCYTHGGGSFDTVVNPVCEIWRKIQTPQASQKIL